MSALGGGLSGAAGEADVFLSAVAYRTPHLLY